MSSGELLSVSRAECSEYKYSTVRHRGTQRAHRAEKENVLRGGGKEVETGSRPAEEAADGKKATRHKPLKPVQKSGAVASEWATLHSSLVSDVAIAVNYLAI